MLDVIDREKLQANALKIGNQILAGLERLKAKHTLIGDVRGKGLLLGISSSKIASQKNQQRMNARRYWKLPGHGVVAWQGRFVWSNDSIFTAFVH